MPVQATGCERVRQELAKYSGWDVNVMAAISGAESGCDPAKNNLSATETHKDINGNVICVGSYGALQIGCVHHRKAPGELNSLVLNIKVAHGVWLEQGYGAWSVYTSGKYLQYL